LRQFSPAAQQVTALALVESAHEGDYTSGAITAAEWRELRSELDPAASAAQADAERLRRQEADTAEARKLGGVEDQAIKRLSELRLAIAGKVGAARGLEAIQASLRGLFECFHLTPADDVTAPDEPDDSVLDCVLVDFNYEIWPQPRAAVMEGIDEDMRPVLKRVALHWQNEREGLTMPSVLSALFGPIPVRSSGSG
jgi:hypothetical protein